MTNAKPFLRWAGGKNWLVKDIIGYLPNKFNNYFEPFLGGGSVYFHLKSEGYIKKNAFLSDLNADLIESYQCIKSYPDLVIQALSQFKNDKDFYYELRNKELTDPIERSAKFLYLNRTSFNGIYRVNQKGQYNVPFGNRTLSKPFDVDNLQVASKMLANSEVNFNDFLSISNEIKPGDLVFLDPPYTVAHENNGFVKYNQRIFSWEDQIRLKDFIFQLNQIGAYFIMTNASHKSIEELYEGVGSSKILNRASLIGGKGAKRATYNELIFTNIINGK